MRVSAYALIPALALAAGAGYAQQQPKADPAGPPAAERTQRLPDRAPGAARGADATGMQGEQQAAAGSAQVIVAQADDQMRADNIIGAPVRSGSGENAEDIGKISDLVFDSDSNLVAAVIGVGGFLGIGAKSVAVSWDALQKVEQDGELAFTSTVSRQQLEDAKAFETREEQEARAAEEQRKQDALQRTQQGATPGMGSGGTTGGAN
ncbi:MAG: PRC-barrel domain-containing protein [Acetobacterales bacterium]